MGPRGVEGWPLRSFRVKIGAAVLRLRARFAGAPLRTNGVWGPRALVLRSAQKRTDFGTPRSGSALRSETNGFWRPCALGSALRSETNGFWLPRALGSALRSET